MCPAAWRVAEGTRVAHPCLLLLQPHRQITAAPGHCPLCPRYGEGDGRSKALPGTAHAPHVAHGNPTLCQHALTTYTRTPHAPHTQPFRMGRRRRAGARSYTAPGATGPTTAGASCGGPWRSRRPWCGPWRRAPTCPGPPCGSPTASTSPTRWVGVVPGYPSLASPLPSMATKPGEGMSLNLPSLAPSRPAAVCTRGEAQGAGPPEPAPAPGLRLPGRGGESLCRHLAER